jgi:hypothetical protein
MFYEYIWECKKCGIEIELDVDCDPGVCGCGGAFQKVGETYDQEFVDQERYEKDQDREYMRRHRRRVEGSL